jgi:phenylalanyl-tRNA synthetase beta chain
MTISHNWIQQYLPEPIDADRLSKILTALGLEVESQENFSQIKGNMQGLVIGQVLTCEKHPDADKLSITTVNIGAAEPLQIVCGAPNVAVNQKVVVATIGTTIYPTSGEPLTMKKAKIRGTESHGMICAEDEIGLGSSHAGIMVLPNDVAIGITAAEYFKPYTDVVYEIGLTPNRMDAMSHIGVARDVCAYLTYHNKKDYTVKLPYKNNFKVDHQGLQIAIKVVSEDLAPRYAGVSIQGVTVAESPTWLKNSLLAIGQKPINNIVDVTNYILHETGQPLHAFDANQIINNQIIVKQANPDTSFTTLDDVTRKLQPTDIVICDGEETPLCIAGVFGGKNSGVNNQTTNIFIESACFNSGLIRTTSLHHNLRTDAATRFEKGVDVSNTVNVLKRAAMLIKEVAGGEIASDVTDVYPNPKPKQELALKFHYLKKLSGKNYHPDAVKAILTKLGFEVIKESYDDIWFTVPHHKMDISLPADLVEEVMRVDGLDNVEIPQFITIAPATETMADKIAYQEKVANFLSGAGLHEIFTNSITNSAFYDDDTLKSTVSMINNLSAELNILRPSMLQTGLQVVAHNLNRKNNNLSLYEFGKTYEVKENGTFAETNNLTIYLTGNNTPAQWAGPAQKQTIYTAKGLAQNVFSILGLALQQSTINNIVTYNAKQKQIATCFTVSNAQLKQFDIKQPVHIVNINWDAATNAAIKQKITFSEISKFPFVQRDVALVVDKNIAYEQITTSANSLKINRLKNIQLFDIFESDKLGPNKKSMAISVTFLDDEKTMTDKEIDGMVQKLIAQFEKDLNAEIRK